jgi:hypothetical protein
MSPAVVIALVAAIICSALMVSLAAWRIGRIGDRRDFAFLGALAAILLVALVCLASGALA